MQPKLGLKLQRRRQFKLRQRLHRQQRHWQQLDKEEHKKKLRLKQEGKLSKHLKP